MAEVVLTSAELARRLGIAARSVRRRAERECWSCHQRCGRGGLETVYPLNTLPDEVKRLFDSEQTDIDGRDEPAGGLWAWFDLQTASRKDRARARLAAVQAIHAGERLEAVALSQEVAVGTLRRWLDAVRGKPQSDWLALLCPSTGKTTGRAVGIRPEFWRLITSDYLRLERPSLSACYRRACAAAKAQGWDIPNIATLRRRISAEIGAEVMAAKRYGKAALQNVSPGIIRDKTVFASLEAVNADGHTMDVFVNVAAAGEAPRVIRPVLSVIQDLRSGKILAWRMDETANSTAVRLALFDLFREHGIPKHVYLDNGREYAAKAITGGSATRFRFKIKPEDMPGILTALGCEVHWTAPYNGRAKPIERAFGKGGFADDFAKHPAFAGAYVGRNTAAKPENYKSRAVPRDEFVKVLTACIAEHNGRRGRRSEVCGGRLSFDEAYAAGLGSVTRATDEQLRMVMLESRPVKVRRGTGEVGFNGWRFNAAFLRQQQGQQVSLRFDPDNIERGVHVYSARSEYLGHADAVRRGGFNDLAAAREHKRDAMQVRRAIATIDQAQARMTAREVAAVQVSPAPAQPEHAKVVQMARVDPRLMTRKAAQATPRSADEIAALERATARANAAPDRAAARVDEAKARYQRAMNVEGNASASDSDRKWLAGYKQTAEYASQQRLAKAFGEQGNKVVQLRVG